MSQTRQTTIWCDGCGEWDQACLAPSEFRRELKRKGWRRVRTSDNRQVKDLCPTCAKAWAQDPHQET